MKFLFSFFAVFYTIAQTCHGKNINHLHVVFVSNVVDPNDYEMETFNELVSYPFIKGVNSSLMTHFGLVVNYTIIFPSEPDHVITLRGLDMDRYSKQYFENLVNNYTSSNCKGKSLKGLRKALEISSEPSIILMAANRKPTDGVLLMEILEAMIAKVNPVIIFQIEDDGSITEIPKSNKEIDANNYIPENLKINKNRLLHEFSAIMEVSADLLNVMTREAKIAENSALQVPNLLATIPRMKYNFTRPLAKRSIALVMGFTNLTKEDLDEISQSMETYFNLRNEPPYNATNHFSVVSSTEPNYFVTIEKSATYTASFFRSILEAELMGKVKEPSLKGLRKALQIVSAFSWIVYYVRDVPTDDHQLLPQIIQLIHDKKVQIRISIHGSNGSSSNPLPVLYRTILDASKMASSSPKVPTNWIEALYIPRKIPEQIKSIENTTPERSPYEFN